MKAVIFLNISQMPASVVEPYSSKVKDWVKKWWDIDWLVIPVRDEPTRIEIFKED